MSRRSVKLFKPWYTKLVRDAANTVVDQPEEGAMTE